MSNHRTSTPARPRRLVGLLAVAVATTLISACAPAPTAGGSRVTGTPLPEIPAALPLRTETAIDGLDLPTNAEFAPDGRVFIAEKSGMIRTWDSITDPTPTVTADLRPLVRNVGDQGLLGLAVDPDWPSRPFLYTLASFDSTGQWGDGCPSPWPGYGVDGCVSGGRIDRLTIDPQGRMVGTPMTLVDDRWCMQFSSHHVGDLTFLSDGTLLASAGEGAAWWDADYGQKGGTGGAPPNATPANPCGDPPGGAGQRPGPSTGEGGAFRSQDLLTPGDPTGWNGALVRLDPDTGGAPPDNPLVGRGAADDDALVAHGFRNPFRLAVRPGTDEVFVADVGWTAFEEIDRTDATDDVVDNFGWPCREGPADQPAFQNLRSPVCAALAGGGAPSRPVDPWFSYFHGNTGRSISGLAFVPDGRYAGDLEGSLLFADFVQGSIWSAHVLDDGARHDHPPTPVAADITAVDLEAAPDGYVYAVDIARGALVRLVDRPSGPVARISTDRLDGPLPLTVRFDASASSSPSGEPLTIDWDLDGDGEFDDATGPQAMRTYTQAVNVDASVRVRTSSDPSVASVRLFPGNTPPVADLQVTGPERWSVGDQIGFTVLGSDREDGTVPVARRSWAVDLHHCADDTDCHVHPDFSGTGSAGFSFTTPEHEAPSFLVLRGSVRDSRGQQATVERRLDPATVRLYVDSFPVTAASVTVGGVTHRTPKGVELIRGSTVVVSTPYRQQPGLVPLTFESWSNGRPRAHEFTVTENTTLVASFSLR